MGLDLAEFLICIEEEFDININDNDSPFEGEIEVTVAMMIDFVERKIREKETAELMAVDYPQKVFKQIKEFLAAYAEVSSEDVLPETQLADLFADHKRWQKIWQTDSNEIREIGDVLWRLSNVDQLYRNTRLMHIVWGLTVMFFFPLLLWLLGANKTGVVIGAISFFVISAPFVWRIGRKIIYGHCRIPPHLMTVGQLAEAITTHRHRHLAADGSPLSRSAIEDRVINILADTIGMKPSDIMFSDRLVQDLKMG